MCITCLFAHVYIYRRMIKAVRFVWITSSYCLSNIPMCRFIFRCCLQFWRYITNFLGLIVEKGKSLFVESPDKRPLEDTKCCGDVGLNLYEDIPGETGRPHQEYRYNDFRFLPIGKRVRLIDPFDEHYFGGSVVWTGLRRRDNERMVVINLDVTREGATFGTFNGQKLIEETSKDKVPLHYMVPVEDVTALPEFKKGDYCSIQMSKNGRFSEGGFIRSESDGRYKLHLLNTDYSKGLPKTQEILFADFTLFKAPPPICDPISDYLLPISGEHLDLFLGRNKGIQGRNNSCYLDTLLFAFFAFNKEQDGILSKNSDSNDAQFSEVATTLRQDIVFSLRGLHFVSYQHVERLRKRLVEHSGKGSFQNEKRDIPECMEALFGKILHMRPMVSIGHSTANGYVFDDVFSVEVLNVTGAPVPTSEQLLEQSAVAMQFAFKEMTDCLLVQLARETNVATCVIPSLELDLKNLIYNTVKVCTECGARATLQFPQVSYQIAATFFCDDCAHNKELDMKTGMRLLESDMSTLVDEDTLLSLSALICIERSHYNCFVRCQDTDRWVFFDSMYDQETLKNRETGKEETFNIPLVEEAPKFRQWLEQAPDHLAKDGDLSGLFSTMGEKEVTRGRRIFECPYLMIYRRDA